MENEKNMEVPDKGNTKKKKELRITIPPRINVPLITRVTPEQMDQAMKRMMEGHR